MTDNAPERLPFWSILLTAQITAGVTDIFIWFGISHPVVWRAVVSSLGFHIVFAGAAWYLWWQQKHVVTTMAECAHTNTVTICRRCDKVMDLPEEN